VAILIVLMGCNRSDGIRLIRKTHLADYPSASAIAFYNHKLYVLGDDAPTMLVLDKDHQLVQRVTLFPSSGKRISKKEKPDIESAYINQSEGNGQLVALSSLSTKMRNKQLTINLLSDTKNPVKNFNVAEFDLDAPGIMQMNLEGATMIEADIILANRANNKHRQNFLIVRSAKDQMPADSIQVIELQLPATNEVIGVSGLEYDKENDMLLFTASTEHTSDATSDGAIGKSYLGCINDFSKKKNQKKLHCKMLIDLTSYLGEKKFQKIESLAIELSTNKQMVLHLAADNDNGESSLYKLEIQTERLKEPA
jgi:hypothetical protein